MRVLIVKTSSMGDVVHALPAVTDMHRALPGVQVDWLVEAPFAAIPRLHAGVARVLPLAWRQWRKSWWAPATRAAMAALRTDLRRERYDAVFDFEFFTRHLLRLPDRYRPDWSADPPDQAAQIFRAAHRLQSGQSAEGRKMSD